MDNGISQSSTSRIEIGFILIFASSPGSDDLMLQHTCHLFLVLDWLGCARQDLVWGCWFEYMVDDWVCLDFVWVLVFGGPMLVGIATTVYGVTYVIIMVSSWVSLHF